MPLERATLNNVTAQRTDGLFERVRTNVLKGNVPLKKRQFTRLQRRKKNLTALANTRTSLKKKKAIVQRGGFSGVVTGACSCSAR